MHFLQVEKSCSVQHPAPVLLEFKKEQERDSAAKVLARQARRRRAAAPRPLDHEAVRDVLRRTLQVNPEFARALCRRSPEAKRILFQEVERVRAEASQPVPYLKGWLVGPYRVLPSGSQVLSDRWRICGPGIDGFACRGTSRAALDYIRQSLLPAYIDSLTSTDPLEARPIPIGWHPELEPAAAAAREQLPLF